MLIQALDLRIFQRGLKQGMQHMEAGFISGKPGAFDLHPAEAAHVDRTVFFAAPRAAPKLQLRHLLRTVLNKVVDHRLLAQPVAARYGVVKVGIEAVLLLGHGGSPALGGNRVAAHRIDFGNQRNLQFRVGFCGGDCRPQSRSTSADNHQIGIQGLHGLLPIMDVFQAYQRDSGRLSPPVVAQYRWVKNALI